MREYTPHPVPQELSELVAYLDRELNALAMTLSQPAFRAPTLQNGWSNYEAGYAEAGFYKDGLGRVHLKGLIQGGTATGGTVLFTLPAGFYPSRRLLFTTMSNGAICRVDVSATGNVMVQSGGSSAWLSLDGISFAAV